MHSFLLRTEWRGHYTCRQAILHDVAQLDTERRQMTWEARNDAFLLSEFELRFLRPEQRCYEILALCRLFFQVPISEPECMARTHYSF